MVEKGYSRLMKNAKSRMGLEGGRATFYFMKSHELE
jgi:hypothetical protein